MALPITASESTITSKNLTRLLSRLDSKLSSSSSSSSQKKENEKNTPRLSAIERAKFAANLEYARQLLLSLESESALIRNTSARQSVLSGLGVQKQAIRRLNEELLVMAAEEEEEGEGDSTDDDDDEVEERGKKVEVSAMPAQANGAPETKPTTTTTLRNRFQPPPSTQTQRAHLFPTPPTTTTLTTEAHLDTHRAEQEQITTSMLSLAQALKQSSMRFGSELENEKALLDLARDSLDKNALGLEGTGRKMDALRRDESVGFLWSVLYPVIIVGLALVVLFVLFFAPKLRWW
ncbi:hypothetical protein L873DRAFT_1810198 [Choiromyces venosus 120613-1]|uniref:Synaptobrevin n=1 Tax=Choiromyces venosus 120613-1 TaxID=1336337 RepID=A0A3N4JFU0_9PEZI|nr:hypothetical protein L873DRAFT_1810198 [Choiromyces venosus 120613-1]